ncbi:MAG: hypothetical protein U5L09_11375 [Bacteroidales bacterium]|nr:hypothetical protein [Bacteroidales bacterium]
MQSTLLNDADDVITATFDASELGSGTHEIYAQLSYDGFGTNIESATLTIQENPLEAQGQITDFFSGEPIAGATVTIDGSSDITDANGNYAIDVTSNAYLETEIRKDSDDYVPRHTWYKYDEVENFDLIPEDMHWLLYNNAFRYRFTSELEDGSGIAPHHWIEQPEVFVFNDSTDTGGVDIEARCKNNAY